MGKDEMGGTKWKNPLYTANNPLYDNPQANLRGANERRQFPQSKRSIERNVQA